MNVFEDDSTSLSLGLSSLGSESVLIALSLLYVLRFNRNLFDKLLMLLLLSLGNRSNELVLPHN